MKKINNFFIAIFIVVLAASAAFSEYDEAINDEIIYSETDDIEIQETEANNETIDIKNVADTKEVIRIKDVGGANKANVVTLLALNKITAKSYIHDVEIGKTVKFERLLIQPLFCWKSSPEEVPENKVLLKITEIKIDKTQEQIFYGWMFSSSPGLSPLEHSMFDITIIDCKIVAKD